ncbi:acetyl/propionyl/methylcrotonyl-CoA carboxylase subunit alpha [Sphingosinicella sp. LHD-64]|uniref:acetyl/propionyl/methylcrotonyl-CoA carboxylase subunit alpha n=1 Tax=Sphingosinicella sp. LHD-64 TaxID=3072139 RepID=UPI00280C8E39|nr:acetyl/propionyl/methylcrotonyl-CoA carboxylase subunit alpha [Sphingosinicella sp. LHD-64]MDQ8755674.1 acetyl/propionyl/methylcrotonyl-CoA carboxylase subunit alpha [Sphingosinicella sp. LHD-64]
MLTSLLIANRGEIACRVIRTARRLGIRTVAVYSDADAKALHVREADEAVHIGPSPARESYLVGEKIIVAAKATGAEAIHPGYGFLSENAAFAQAVIDAGLIWVGPKPASITAMGLKDAAKKLMADAGVPVTPGYLGENQDPARLKAEADAIVYPVLIKAVAGGGGKGMRRVDAARDFADALLSCKREAASSFGDDRVLIEKYILRPRHIEVQVFGDTHGNVVHLFERDCSLQRRHQKVIEEAPAPGFDWALREVVCGAAVRAAKAVDYVGAGTIEFIADASEGLRGDRVWFMEMNTRLQVEHPVTEEITGQDLVEWQLRVASGEPVPKRQEELSIDGWAMEARLYAEDPASGFLPSTGTLEQFLLDDRARIDTGVEQGDRISPFYDPMIAKLIAWGHDREAARERLLGALAGSHVAPVKTNGGFLYECLEAEAFRMGDVDTGLIARSGDELMPLAEPSQAVLDAAAAGEKDRKALREWADPDLIQPGPWGFRLNADPQTVVDFSLNGCRLSGRIDRAIEGVGYHWQRVGGDIPHLILTERGQTFRLGYGPSRAEGGAAAGDGAIVSPMPGKIIALEVAAGNVVTKGQKLLTLEAMKMEHSLAAPFDGKVAELNAEAGAQVSEGALLVRIEKEGG